MLLLLVAKLCPPLRNSMDCSLPGSSVHGFPRQYYWSGFPSPFPGYLTNPETEPFSPAWHVNSLPLSHLWVFPVVQSVKSFPAMQKTHVQSLGCEDPLEMEMATHSSILAWRIPWTKEPGGLCSPWGHKGSDITEWHIWSHMKPFVGY